jgi:hypothetical protein
VFRDRTGSAALTGIPPLSDNLVNKGSSGADLAGHFGEVGVLTGTVHKKTAALLLAGVFALGGCAKVVATPGVGKTAVAFERDDALCRRMAIGKGDGTEAYARCMRARGDSVQIAGGGSAQPNGVATASNPPQRPYSPPSSRTGSLKQLTSAQAAGTSVNDSRYASLLDQLVTQDSKSWAMNKYDPGSMRSTATIRQSSNGTHLTVVGHYSYNRGQPGWVQAEFSNGKLSCLLYWDFPNDCRPLGQGLGPQLEALAAQTEAQARNQRRYNTAPPSSGDEDDGGSFYETMHKAGKASRERAMEDINNERYQPLSRGDLRYEEMNNPESPRPDEP